MAIILILEDLWLHSNNNIVLIFKKIKSDQYLKHRKELIIKLSIILNKHIHYWLQKEMPKFSKLQLEKHIHGLLKHLKK